MPAEIVLYEPSLAPQIADLFQREYGTPPAVFLQELAHCYEHPYQRERTFAVVALEDGKVTGFNGFSAWPYVLGGRTLDTFQSRHTLLDSARRGRGTFQQLMNFATDEFRRRRADFLTGFPVDAAKAAFVRNGWVHVLDLQWYVKLTNAFAFARRARFDAVFSRTAPQLAAPQPEQRFRLTTEPAFVQWRRRNALFFHRSLELKAIRRGRFIRDVVVGDVRGELTAETFPELATAARRAGATWLSIAVNPREPLASGGALERAGFRQVNRRIAFIVKPIAWTGPATDASLWTLYRSDIDTW